MITNIQEIAKFVSEEPLMALEEIRSGLISIDSEQRLKSLFHLRRRIEEERGSIDYFDLVKALIEDTDNDCRWQVVIILSTYMMSRRDQVWDIVIKYGSSEDEDMRSAISTVLLEVMLSNNTRDFEEKLGLIKQEIDLGNNYLKDTLSLCWINFASQEQEQLFLKIKGEELD